MCPAVAGLALVACPVSSLGWEPQWKPLAMASGLWAVYGASSYRGKLQCVCIYMRAYTENAAHVHSQSSKGQFEPHETIN